MDTDNTERGILAKTKIFIDIDDVTSESMIGVINVMGKGKGWDKEKIEKNIKAVSKWSFGDIFKNTDCITLDELKSAFRGERINGEGLFDILQPFNGAKEVINSWYDSGKYEINFCTVGEEENLRQKKIWLKDLGIKYHNFYGVPWGGSKDKEAADMEGAFFIDDRSKNLVESNATYKLLFKGYGDAQYRNQTKERDWQMLKDVCNLSNCYVFDNTCNTAWYEIQKTVDWVCDQIL